MNFKNNQIEISGMVNSEITFDHSNHKETFVRFSILSERKSGVEDELLVIANSILCEDISYGSEATITGNIRTMNYTGTDGKRHMKVYIFANSVSEHPDEKDKNNVYLEGTICKEPVYRTTPSGREITDVFLAVNRNYGKSDYIPCICWGINAKKADKKHVGDKICVTGRFQSRNYAKNLNDMNFIFTAYEVSVREMEELEEKEDE